MTQVSGLSSPSGDYYPYQDKTVPEAKRSRYAKSKPSGSGMQLWLMDRKVSSPQGKEEGRQRYRDNTGRPLGVMHTGLVPEML